MSRKYKFGTADGAYFISFATVYWIDVFTRDTYCCCIAESLDYCRKNKGMELYGYCIMLSHVHLIFRSSNNDPSGLIRDFKGFTSRKLLKLIAENQQESRKEWLLWMFNQAARKNSNVKHYQFWQQHNKPIAIWSLKVFEQKLEYIHNNPVESGFVTDAVDWKFSTPWLARASRSCPKKELNYKARAPADAHYYNLIMYFLHRSHTSRSCPFKLITPSQTFLSSFHNWWSAR